MSDAEARARHGVSHPQRACCAPHERRLAGPELTSDEDDVPLVQVGRKLRAQRFGRPGIRRFNDVHGHDCRDKRVRAPGP